MNAIDISELIVEPEKIAKFIDHTNLKPDATKSDIEKLCREAMKHRFYAVCVNPSYIGYCAGLLRASPVKVCSVAGFPLGATSSDAKAYEAKTACQMGAKEIDMVINIGALRSGDFDAIKYDIEKVIKVVPRDTIVKVIIETCYLTREQKIKACQIIVESGAHFVKTSTGFGTGGATVEDIRLLREVVGDKIGVKASGGIRDFKTALEMIKAGATRIGTSSGVKIVSSNAYLV
jgi:deoxyribose-phosphate aldolase